MKLTEKEIMYILHEAKMLLTEDQESDSIKKAIALYMDRMGCDKKAAEKFVRIDLRNDFPNLRDKKPGKFILGVTRMFLNGDFRTGEAIEPLNTTLTYVASDAHYNEYDKNLNGLSANDIINRFADAVKADAEADKEKLAQQEYIANDDYDIVRVDNFEETSQYRQYCYPEDPWCITKYPSMLDSYTNNGIGQFYFCLRKGFENMEPIQGEGCPLDEYGTSMFAVCVDGNGRLKTSTCRWNHSNGGNDHILTTEQVSNLIGRNFYDVFKPNNKLAERLEDIKNRLKNGEDFREIFSRYSEIVNGIFKVILDDFGVNLFDSNTNELLSDKWFDYCEGKIINGFIEVRINEKNEYFSISDRQVYSHFDTLQIIGNKINQLLSSGIGTDELQEQIKFSRFFRNVFLDHIEIVCMGLSNIIEDNKIKFTKWYYSLNKINDYHSNNKNLYRVADPETKQQYIINEKEENVFGATWEWVGTYISEQGCISIGENSKINLVSIDNPHKKLCKRSFDIFAHICCKRKDGSYIIEGQDKEGYLLCDQEGNNLFGCYFDDIRSTHSRIVSFLRKDNKSALFYKDELTLSEWYDNIEMTYVSEYSPLVKVYNNGKENRINCKTKMIFPYWCDEIIDLYNDFLKIKNNGMYNLIDNENGRLVSQEWFANLELPITATRYFIVTNKEGKQNILFVNYKELTCSYQLKHWYDKIEMLNSTTISVEENGQTHTCSIYEDYL